MKEAIFMYTQKSRLGFFRITVVSVTEQSCLGRVRRIKSLTFFTSTLIYGVMGQMVNI